MSTVSHAVSGVLKGYDQLLNLVLDEALEYMRGGLARCVYHCWAA